MIGSLGAKGRLDLAERASRSLILAGRLQRPRKSARRAVSDARLWGRLLEEVDQFGAGRAKFSGLGREAEGHLTGDERERDGRCEQRQTHERIDDDEAFIVLEPAIARPHHDGWSSRPPSVNSKLHGTSPRPSPYDLIGLNRSHASILVEKNTRITCAIVFQRAGDAVGLADRGLEAPRRWITIGEARAFAIAVLIHGGLLLIVIEGRHPGGMAGGGAAGAQATAQGASIGTLFVSLVPEAVIPHAGAANTSNADPLAAIMQQQRGRAPTSFTPTRITAKISLDGLLAQADREANVTKANPNGPAVSAGKWVSAVGKTAQVQQRTGVGSEAQTGDLWSQVQPCWRRALLTSTVPVMLEIQLDAAGRLVRAPQVAEIGRGELQAQRISTERALQAIAACLPYSGPSGRGMQGSYQIQFGTSG
jgi:hypothetical protein